jgi:hypothetical protein
MFLQLYVLPEFALHISSSDYKNLPYFTFCTSVLKITHPRQWTSFPVSSHKWFSLKIHTINWLLHGCKWFVCAPCDYTMDSSMRGICHCHGPNSSWLQGQILSACILIQYNSTIVALLPCKINAPKMTIVTQWPTHFHKSESPQKYSQAAFLHFPVPMWLHFVKTKLYCGII